ncbi:MAG: tail fiber domain-containing protein [Bacteroidales bacterium]|nr:tail fiber domain-containing protein [Bacteroidales bacterium]
MKNNLSLTFCILSVLLFCSTLNIHAQNVTITDDSTYNAHSSAMLDVYSNTKGFLMPRTHPDSISNPAQGLMIFEPNSAKFYFYDGSAWIDLATISGGDSIWTQDGSNNYVFLTIDTNRVGIGIDTPQAKLDVMGDDFNNSSDTVPLFVVRDKDGREVFVVYPKGVFIYVDTLSSGTKSTTNEQPTGFRVGKKTDVGTKDFEHEYFTISPNPEADTVSSTARILWYPLKEAFMAGRVIVESPDSVGLNSWASGFESKSIGNYSQALGYKSRALGNYSTAIGNFALAEGDNSFSLGDSAVAGSSGAKGTANNSFAFGKNAEATGNSSYAFGLHSLATGPSSFALGEASEANGVGSFAFGSIGKDTLGNPFSFPTVAEGDFSFSIGMSSKTEGNGSVALGVNNFAKGKFSLALGNTSITDGSYAVAIGNYTSAAGSSSVSIGNRTKSNDVHSVAIGYNAETNGYGANAIGVFALADSANSTAIGTNVKANEVASIAIGNESEALGWASMVMGRYSFARSMSNITIGNQSEADSSNAIVVGHNASAIGNNALSLGNGTQAISLNSLSIGAYTTASDTNTIAIGQSSTASGNYGMVIGSSSTASGVNSIAIGNNNSSSGEGTITIGNWNTANNYFAVAMGNSTTASGLGSFAHGSNASSTGNLSFSVGNSTEADGDYAMSFGDYTSAQGSYSLAFGWDATSSGNNCLSFGYKTEASNYYSLAFGSQSKAISQHSYAFGNNSEASHMYSTAIGNSAKASGYASTAIGDVTSAKGNYSTAIGEGIIAKAINSFVVGRYNDTTGTTNTWLSNEPLFIVGSGSAHNSRSNALTVLKNGNVGLGTISPSQKLDIDGQIRIRGGNPGAGKILTSDANGVGSWASAIQLPSGTANQTLRYDGNGWAASSILINDGSKIGIGTTSPNSKLHVNSAVSENALRVQVNGSTKLLVVSNGGTSVGTSSTNAPANGLYVEGQSLIGLGTSSALYNANTKLQVQTDLRHAGYFSTDSLSYLSYVIYAKHDGTGTGSDTRAVRGEAIPGDGYGIGGDFYGGYQGVAGLASAGAYSGTVYGVWGRATGTTGTRYGVYGSATGGTTNYGLYCSGNGAYTGTWLQVSDIKFKKNIKSMEGALAKVIQLEPKTYEMRIEEYENMNFNSGTRFGLIAQELKQVFPELVSLGVHPSDERGKEIEYESVDYISLIPILIQAIKEQQVIIENQNIKIEDLESLRTEIQELRNIITSQSEDN